MLKKTTAIQLKVKNNNKTQFYLQKKWIYMYKN